MNIEYVPLLQVARDLHAVPRGIPRFRKYLRTIGGNEPGRLALPPLVAMNPMGREHVTALLNDLLATVADLRTAVEYLFGDVVGATLNFIPRGLRPWAGLVLALNDARRSTGCAAAIA